MEQTYSTTLKIVEAILQTHQLSGELTAQLKGVSAMGGACRARLSIVQGKITSCLIENGVHYISGKQATQILHEKGKLNWTLSDLQPGGSTAQRQQGTSFIHQERPFILTETTILQRNPSKQPTVVLFQTWPFWKRHILLLFDGYRTFQQVVFLVSKDQPGRVLQVVHEFLAEGYVIPL